jgi:hypothetical protein
VAPPPAAPAPHPAPAALPTSIYDPAPPPAAVAAPPPRAAAPVQAQAAAAPRGDFATPRFYSLHRAYGQAPDPVPLSPQFFATPTPDLAAPPPPPPRTVVTSSGQVVRTMSGSSDPAVN